MICLLAVYCMPVAAQVPTICFYADSAATSCTLTDSIPGMLQIFVVHSYEAGATAVEFKAPIPKCMTGTVWLYDKSTEPIALGDSQKGIAIAYGRCLTEPAVILTISLMTKGKSEKDCAYRFFRKQGRDAIYTATCDREKLETTRGVIYVNSSKQCECGALTDVK
jgi:hypothetical protein